MPWNDKSNPGPWGSPPPGSGDGGRDGKGKDGGRKDEPRSPWSRPPGGGPTPPPREPRDPKGGPSFQGPDLDELTRDLRQRFDRVFRTPSGGWNVRAVAAALAALVGLWLLTGVFVVQPNEQAVVTRFGAYAGTATESGLQYRAPWPIEDVTKVPVTTVQRTDIGGPATEGARAVESLMLTGDENIVDLDFTVQWRVSDAGLYLFTLDDPQATVRAVAESAMREVVGRTALEPIISTGRGQVQQQVETLMQRVLDAYGAGIQVVEVQIRNANPPAEVVPAFREVASAGQEAESRVNQATAYRNRRVNEANGSAAAIRQGAEGYREQAIREAEGAAARFNQVYEQYRTAPDVTRRRLYLETLERVVRDSRTVVVDSRGANAPIILPPSAIAPAQPAQPQPQTQAPAASAGAAQ